MLLNQCGAEVTLEDSMEGSSSIFVNSKEDEESDGEIEEGGDPKAIIDEREADLAFSECDEESDGEIEEGSDPKAIIDECEADKAFSEWDEESDGEIEEGSYPKAIIDEREADKAFSEWDEESDGEIEEGSDPKAIIDEREADKAFSECGEESDGEIEEGSDPKVKIEEREAEFDMLMAPEWDVDSLDGLEYYSSPELQLSSSDEPLSDDEEAIEHYRIYKRQIIESKGFYADPELRPSHHYKRIRPMRLEWKSSDGITFQEYWEEMVGICLQKLNQDKGLNVEFVEVVRGYYRGAPRSKSYITFMAREKPDGPLVEYQAKCMLTFDGKLHPILCRPAPTPKP